MIREKFDSVSEILNLVQLYYNVMQCSDWLQHRLQTRLFSDKPTPHSLMFTYKLTLKYHLEYPELSWCKSKTKFFSVHALFLLSLRYIFCFTFWLSLQCICLHLIFLKKGPYQTAFHKELLLLCSSRLLAYGQYTAKEPMQS